MDPNNIEVEIDRDLKMDNNLVGRKLRIIREERGLSQRELAQKAGISTNAVSLIERDENSPSVSTLQSLATALNVKMSYFLMIMIRFKCCM